jgi:hypothetical protein
MSNAFRRQRGFLLAGFGKRPGEVLRSSEKYLA